MATSKPIREGVGGRGGGGGGAQTHQRHKSITSSSTTTLHSSPHPSGRQPSKQSSLPNSPGRSPPPPSGPTATSAPTASFLRPTVSSSLHQQSSSTFPSSSTHKKQSTTKPPSTTLKDKEKTHKASSSLHKATISYRPISDKALVSAPKSVKPSAVSRVRSPGIGTRKIEANHGSIFKTSIAPPTSLTATTIATNNGMVIDKEEEKEVKSEIEESENISIASIEEHLVEELPDPVELKNSSEDVASGTSLLEIEEPHEVSMDVEVDQGDEKKLEEKNEECSKGFIENVVAAGGDIEKPKEEEVEAREKEEYKLEAEAEKKKPVLVETEIENPTLVAEGETEEPIIVGEPSTATMAEAATEKREKEEEKKEMGAAATTAVRAPRRKEEAPKSNDVIEKEKSKLLGERKSKVKALVGAFETVMSVKENESQTGQTQEKEGEGESMPST